MLASFFYGYRLFVKKFKWKEIGTLGTYLRPLAYGIEDLFSFILTVVSMEVKNNFKGYNCADVAWLETLQVHLRT